MFMFKLPFHYFFNGEVRANSAGINLILFILFSKLHIVCITDYSIGKNIPLLNTMECYNS